MKLVINEFVRIGYDLCYVSGESTHPRPNPANPMEYCSTIPPHQQVAAQGSAGAASPPSVIVPVGVLKRPDATSTSGENRTQGDPKSVSDIDFA